MILIMTHGDDAAVIQQMKSREMYRSSILTKTAWTQHLGRRRRLQNISLLTTNTNTTI